ncbi:hypothetical protein [Actinacidiphila glaucinigra]|uniref:hypothetical protein n=1 Tax=Actinacidiphila glaucinigra TaxID=235986 RepID=UPI003722500A
MIGLMRDSTRDATAAVEAVLRLAAPRQRMVDDHMFRARTATGHESTFRLQLFTAPGTRPVAVATQTAGEGTFLTNGAERFAAAVWERHFPADPQPPLWIQRQLRDTTTHFPEVFQLVIFADVHPYRLRQPGWATITPEQLEDLVGLPVATDRGTGYTPPPADPEPQVSFEVMAVRRLARPRPFREPDCMPSGIRWWRRWARQARPRRGSRTCCWYHGGDWHQVNAMALEVLAHARAASVSADSMENLALEHAATAGADRWQTQALATLFNTAHAIDADSRGYTNGQHRAQAMLDAGVRHTVVLSIVWPDESP